MEGKKKFSAEGKNKIAVYKYVKFIAMIYTTTSVCQFIGDGGELQRRFANCLCYYDYYALRCATIPSLCCLFHEKEFSMQGACPRSCLALTTSLALGFVKVSLDGGKKEILSGRKK